LLAGFVVRCIYVGTKWNEPLLLNDSLYYSSQAVGFWRGRVFREFLLDQPGAEHGPLTPVVLAPFSWMGNAVPWQRVATACIGLASVAILVRVAWLLGGRRVAIIAGVIAALYPNLWVNDGLVMSESLSILLVCAVLSVCLDSREWAPRRLFLVGALCGAAALARSELILLVPLVAAMVWRDTRRSEGRPAWTRAATVVGAATTVLAPWAVFNVVRFEDRVLLTTNDGATLLGSYCPEVLYGSTTGTWSLNCVLNAPGVTADMDPSERSTEYRRQGLASARDNAERLPIVVVARLARALDVWGFDQQLRQDTGEERPEWVVWAGIVTFWMLAPLAMLGMRGIARRDRWVLVGPCLVVLVMTVAFYGGHRIRSTMEPTIVLGAALALSRWWAGRSVPSPSVFGDVDG
jgi:4-amino-4-deoxy-L-arabinose transferase-like glycosyltransferase